MTIKPFSLTDTAILNSNLETAIQIRKKIFELCITNKSNPLLLPKSVVPTASLYDLVISYEAALRKLIEAKLLAETIETQEQTH